jgi:hypothetical protein
VLVLLHQVFSQTSVISLIVIFLGSVIYGYNDIAFHAEGYFWGSAYCLALVFNNTYIKNTFNKYQGMSDNEKTYYNNLVIFPFNVALMLYEESFEYLRPHRPSVQPATSAPGLRSPLPHSAPGLGSPLPHLHRDLAHRYHILHRDWAHRCHICTGTGQTVGAAPESSALLHSARAGSAHVGAQLSTQSTLPRRTIVSV